MKPKKKLLVFTSTFPRWKDDTNPPFVYELSRRLTDDFEVHVLAPGFPGAKDFEVMDNMRVQRFRYFPRRYEKLAGSGGILPTLRKNKWYYFQVPFFLLGEYLALRKTIKKIRPDIIHAHWIIPQGWICSLMPPKLRANYVITAHGADVFGLQGRLTSKIKRQALKKAGAITAVSSAIKKEIRETIDPGLEIEVVPMGVDSKLFNPDKKDKSIKKKYHINGPFLLFVGRLAEKKGAKYLLEAMPHVINHDRKAKLIIIGSGPMDRELKNRAKDLNIENHVIFTGPVPNSFLPEYYATADIFIGPSIKAEGGDTEGFGLTFVEAGMSGCWLIGSDVGGIPEIIRDGENGFLVREKDPGDISEKIIKSLGIIKKGHGTLNGFEWKRIKEKYAEILKRGCMPGTIPQKTQAGTRKSKPRLFKNGFQE